MWTNPVERSLQRALTTRVSIVGKCETVVTIVARVGNGAVVRRSARLIAAAVSESSPHPILVDNHSSRVPQIKSQIKNCIANAMKEQDGSHKQAEVTKAEFRISETKTLRRTKSLKRLPSRDLEMKLWELGFQNFAGVDEVGRGPLVGPVVAAACIIPASVTIPSVDDSKKLTGTQREELYAQIVATPGVAYVVHVVDAAKIDEIKILQATLLVMSMCIKNLKTEKGENARDYILVGGNRLPDDLSKGKSKFVVNP